MEPLTSAPHDPCNLHPQAELVLRTEELRESLWAICDQKMEEAENERTKQASDTFLQVAELVSFPNVSFVKRDILCRTGHTIISHFFLVEILPLSLHSHLIFEYLVVLQDHAVTSGHYYAGLMQVELDR
jgi:hypothetical protein